MSVSFEELAAELKRDVEWIAGPELGERHLWNGKAPRLFAAAARIVAEFQRADYAEVQREAYTVPKSVFPNLRKWDR